MDKERSCLILEAQDFCFEEVWLGPKVKKEIES